MTAPTTSHQSLGSTAMWTAAVRAAETQRADRMFDDPWAAALAGAEGEAWAAARTPQSYLPIAVRTRYFDDFLLNVAAEGVARQFVLMAAGLDTRAYRLRWPGGTRLFELDQPEVLLRKERVLAEAGARPAVERTAIGADLAAPWEDLLVKAGFEADEPSCWLLEGFLFYLPGDTVRRILAQVSALAAAGSRLGFDIINGEVLTSPYTRAWIEMQAAAGAPWLGTQDDPAGYLAGLGWAANLTQIGQPDATYGRYTGPVIPVTAPGLPHNWYVTTRRNS